jgi:hypothetical protein
MDTVVAELSMSLDGFVADPSDQVGPLFDWYRNGDVEVPTAVPDRGDPPLLPRQAEVSCGGTPAGVGGMGSPGR